jgi:aerobic-type carbon monoxide dehydrogenase small subunit (CoxS/CutS family)
MNIAFTLNGAAVEVDAEPTESLLTVLRARLGIRSVRETCGIGVCGACTALVDGEPISACLLLAPLAEGAHIVTAEGIGHDHPVHRAFAEAHAFQCGFCTPGFILTVVRLLEECPRPTDEEIALALAGNLCRCGSYLKIVDAVRRAVATAP